MAYMVMAYVVVAHIVMAYIVIAYIALVYLVMAYIVMAYIVIACIFMTLYSYGSGCLRSIARLQHLGSWEDVRHRPRFKVRLCIGHNYTDHKYIYRQ